MKRDRLHVHRPTARIVATFLAMSQALIGAAPAVAAPRPHNPAAGGAAVQLADASVQTGPAPLPQPSQFETRPPVPWSLPEDPTDRQLFESHAFEEPLVAQGGEEGVGNASLAKAVLAYVRAGQSENVSALTAFLAANPDTRWRGALLVNLGVIYRRYGYISRAIGAFDE